MQYEEVLRVARQADLAQRYFKIVHPVKHRQKFRPWMKWVGVALPWIDGVLLGVPVITATTLFHRDATVCRALVVFVSPAAKKVGRYKLFCIVILA